MLQLYVSKEKNNSVLRWFYFLYVIVFFFFFALDSFKFKVYCSSNLIYLANI